MQYVLKHAKHFRFRIRLLFLFFFKKNLCIIYLESIFSQAYILQQKQGNIRRAMFTPEQFHKSILFSNCLP